MENKIAVKFKKLDNKAVVPKYAKPGDAGLDIVAVSVSYDEEGMYYQYDTGLSAEIPAGYVGLIFPRSSISNYDLRLCNAVGVIDSQYRGPIMVRMKTDAVHPSVAVAYKPGDRVAQLIVLPYPQVEPVEADELSGSARGAGGFGSSGR